MYLETKMDLQGIVYFGFDPNLMNEITEEKRERTYFNKPLSQQIETTVRVWHKIIEKVGLENIPY